MTAVRHIALPVWVAAVLLFGGCTYDRHPEIPSDARMLTEGDKVLSQSFQEPGTVYVFDRNTNNMIYAGHVDAGQTIMVDPEHNRISLDGRTVYDKGLSGGDTRRIFFEPGAPSRQVTVEERREIK